MKIRELIDRMIDMSGTQWQGRYVDRVTDRDRILWGNPEQECRGIVTTIYASVEVIEKAYAEGCNLIVCHEALFWNHGDHTDWLKDNTAFQKKKELLDRYGICVWRNHDHIHAGVKLGDVYRDGIFYGLSSMMGWNDYILDRDDLMPTEFLIPEVSAHELAEQIMEKFHLETVRFIGNPETAVRRIHLPLHIMGKPSDNDLIRKINDENINCLLCLELVDFTVSEYIHDAGMLKEDKCIFALGHFNFEEIGMEYYAGYIKENIVSDIPVCFIQAGDYFSYISETRKGV